MKILFITRGSLVGSNNSGNTIINIFGGMEDVTFYNLYFRAEASNTQLCERSCQVSEVSLMRRLKGGSDPVTVTARASSAPQTEGAEQEQSIYAKNRNQRSRLMWFGRELLWKTRLWNNKTLHDFIHEVSPDLIFMPSYGCWYPYEVLQTVHKLIPNVPVFLYHFDDNYSLNQSSFYPSFWLYRFRLRHHIRKAQKIASKTYVISQVQKDDYDRMLKLNCDLLTKGAEFSDENKSPVQVHDPVRLCYTGNLGDGRLEILQKISASLAKAGCGELHIYSATKLLPQQQEALERDPHIVFHGAIAPQQVRQVQCESDILIHVEDFSKRNRKLTRHSISTKIFDYLAVPRCVLAVGPADIASMTFLKDAAITVNDLSRLDDTVARLVTDPKRIEQQAEAAWQYGRKHLDIGVITERLREDMKTAKETNAL